MLIRDCMKQDVITINASLTIREAAMVVVNRHVGLLPIIDKQGKLIGVVGLHHLLALELPDFVNFFIDIDFVRDFGAVETTRPDPDSLAQPITTLMRPAISVNEECGLVRAYTLMLQHRLLDLPVVAKDGRLIGLASRVDIGAAILSRWQFSDSEQV
jgi:CBS domain-containing protein